MDLPSHALWTYALEKAIAPEFTKTHPQFLFFSVLFAILPDIIADGPFVILISLNKKKYGLQSLKDVPGFAYDIHHNRPLEYAKLFPWSARLSFYSHSCVVYLLMAVILGLTYQPLLWPFIIGYGAHLLIDLPLHQGYFSSQPLYPFHGLAIPGRLTWYNSRSFQKYNYAALAAAYLILIIFHRV